MLKQDDKLTAFHTGLPSYTILVSMFKYTTKRLQESTSSGNKLSNFQCFLLTLMKLRLNLSNFDLGFRFCILTNFKQVMLYWLIEGSMWRTVAYRGASLNIPAFTKGKSQLPSADVESTRRLANVRIHVERVIGSVIENIYGSVRQKFQILSETTSLPTQYTRSKDGSPTPIDSIVRVCCALPNACDIIVPAT